MKKTRISDQITYTVLYASYLAACISLVSINTHGSFSLLIVILNNGSKGLDSPTLKSQKQVLKKDNVDDHRVHVV